MEGELERYAKKQQVAEGELDRSVEGMGHGREMARHVQQWSTEQESDGTWTKYWSRRGIGPVRGINGQGKGNWTGTWKK
jgi:hypothetical protein